MDTLSKIIPYLIILPLGVLIYELYEGVDNHRKEKYIKYIKIAKYIALFVTTIWLSYDIYSLTSPKLTERMIVLIVIFTVSIRPDLYFYGHKFYEYLLKRGIF